MFNAIKKIIERKNSRRVFVYTNNNNVVNAINSINTYGCGPKILSALMDDGEEVVLLVEGDERKISNFLLFCKNQKVKGIDKVISL